MYCIFIIDADRILRNGSIRCLAMLMFQSVSGACAWDNVSSQVLNPIFVPIFKEFFLRCHRHIYIQAPKGTRTWGGIQNQVAENKIDYCTFLHKFFKVSLPYWSLNAHQPRAEYKFGSQVIKLIVVPIIVQHLFLTRVLLQVSLLEGFAGQLYEKGRQRHPNMKFHALFQYICFLFILESLLSK